MRRVVVLLVGTVFSLIFFAFATAWAQAPPWTLAWSDEFNGTAIDTTAWNVENSAYPSTDYGGVLQYWLPANVIVGNETGGQ